VGLANFMGVFRSDSRNSSHQVSPRSSGFAASSSKNARSRRLWGRRRFFGDSVTGGLLDCLRLAPIGIVLQHEKFPGVRDPGGTLRHKEYHSAGELGEHYYKEFSSAPGP
jgi:hypothetical protein